jgi:glycine dehydrogenase subunit 1
MRYIPCTSSDLHAMLETIGTGSIDDLLASIPPELRAGADASYPARLSDPELLDHLERVAARNVTLSSRPSFLGAGVYRHFVPPVVDSLAARGEFLSAYTPYQPEASQGSLQAAFEFQSLVCELTGLEVASASLYDGATAMVEAMFMVAAILPEEGAAPPRFVVSRGIHPEYLEVARTYAASGHFVLEELPVGEDGCTRAADVSARVQGAAGFVFQSPAFHGTIEDAAALTAAAHAGGALAIQVFDPHSLSLLAPPGETGVDIACGEGQSLGSRPSFGGPSLGLLAARGQLLRRMPGRLVGETVDADGRIAYANTLQTREQHIRRARATSNICTNAAHMALRATIYLSVLGKAGMCEVAEISVRRAHHLADRIASLRGFSLRFPASPFFCEVAIRCPRPAAEIERALAERGIIAGLDLGRFDPTEADTMLFCATEMTTPDDIERLVASLAEVTR